MSKRINKPTVLKEEPKIEKVDNKKNYKIILFCLLILSILPVFFFLKQKNQEFKDLQIHAVNLSEIITNQKSTITNLNFKTIELNNLITKNNEKIAGFQANLTNSDKIIQGLKTELIEKEIRIKDLSIDKTALESDSKAIKNTLVKMTSDIINYSDELKKATTEQDQNQLLKKVISLTENRDLLINHLKNYEKVQMEIKQENALIALKIRENLKKEGYEFQNKLEDWPKPNETLITIPKQNLQQRIEQITNPIEPKKEEIIKKPSFWDKIRK